MHNLLHRRQLHGQRNLGTTCKNGRRFGLNVHCHLENLKPLSKLDLYPKSSCLIRPWNKNKSSSLVMEGKNITTQQKSSKGPNVGYYKNNHFYLKPLSLVIV